MGEEREEKEEVRAAFRTSEFTEAIKEFRGVIVDADFAIEPFGIKGAPEIDRKTPQVCFKVITDEYEKPQYIWLPPSTKKKTKWWYFIEALEKSGAMSEIKIEGNTDEERIRSFMKSMIGMEFYWQEREVEILGGKGKTARVILPLIYYGKKQVGQVKEETIGGVNV